MYTNFNDCFGLSLDKPMKALTNVLTEMKLASILDR